MDSNRPLLALEHHHSTSQAECVPHHYLRMSYHTAGEKQQALPIHHSSDQSPLKASQQAPPLAPPVKRPRPFD